LTFGEGWHNNHHAHPTSARHGLEWYEIDMNWYAIGTLERLGLATHVKRVRATRLVRKEILSDGNPSETGTRQVANAAQTKPF
jgi:fatty-acid desaturase